MLGDLRSEYYLQVCNVDSQFINAWSLGAFSSKLSKTGPHILQRQKKSLFFTLSLNLKQLAHNDGWNILWFLPEDQGVGNVQYAHDH